MIIGIGIDIVELKRIKRSIDRQIRFPKRILTDQEYRYFNELASANRQVEFLAGRFAAKEAFAKATGRGIGELSFHHIEILSQRHGAPIITVDGYEEIVVHLSISHSKEYAVAQVVLEQR